MIPSKMMMMIHYYYVRFTSNEFIACVCKFPKVKRQSCFLKKVQVNGWSSLYHPPIRIFYLEEEFDPACKRKNLFCFMFLCMCAFNN
jgi:hypothetical protein